MPALPPLRSLEAFRAVMRHGGFNAAARVLGITPSAVSHRVRELERVLASPLFERRNRKAFPTDAAHRYYEALQEGFQRLEAATRVVSQPSGAEILSLHCSPSFAAQWLMPRLKRFIRAHPEFVVRLSSTPDSFEFSDDVYDLDIQYARPVPAGCDAIVLADEIITPLCAPDYFVNAPARLLSTDFEPMTLLHSVRNIVQWQHWFMEFAPEKPLPLRGMQFDRSFMAIAAACDGLGLCLESTLIAESEIASGRLIQPFPKNTMRASGHRLVWRRKAVLPKKIVAFRDWLLMEMEHPQGEKSVTIPSSSDIRDNEASRSTTKGPRISNT